MPQKIINIPVEEDFKRRVAWAVDVLHPGRTLSHVFRDFGRQMIRQAEERARLASDAPQGDRISEHQWCVLRAVMRGFWHLGQIMEFTGLHREQAWTAAMELVDSGKLQRVYERVPKRGRGRPSPLFIPAGYPTGDRYHVSTEYVGDALASDEP